MNKREAKNQAYRNERTVSELLELIKSNRGIDGVSRLNPGLSKKEALDILERPLLERDPESMPDEYRDVLLVQNILRECG